MLPKFPVFKNLEASDKLDVEKITSRFAPYSDFNFLSLWCWDIDNLVRISELNGNLVVKFTDYVTKKPFYSFIGNNNCDDTATKLIQFSEIENIEPRLQLIPEEALVGLDDKKFKIEESRDHFDYIYPINEIKTYQSPRLKKQRELVNYFERNYKYTVERINLSDKRYHNLMLMLLDKWVENKKAKSELEDSELQDHDNEYKAFNRLLNAPEYLLSSVVCYLLFTGDELSAFMIDEIVSKKYCISHFGKINKFHKGNMQILMKNSAENFSSHGIEFYNDEQDLGLSNLRSSKSSYILDHFLKKYTLTLNK
jgi:hypothetical protein